MIRCAPWLLMACFSFGCSEGHDDDHDHHHGGDACEQHSDCGANEFCDEGTCHEVHSSDVDGGAASVDTYRAGLEKIGEMGQVKLTLVESNPIPRDLTLYTWQLLLTDVDGNPIDGAQIVAEPRMPDHGHGTNPQFTEAMSVEGAGRYELVDLNLFMAGVFQNAWSDLLVFGHGCGNEEKKEGDGTAGSGISNHPPPL